MQIHVDGDFLSLGAALPDDTGKMLDFGPLEEMVRRLGPPACTLTTIAEMPGGASTRKYFRVALHGGDAETAVAMFVPDGPKPEEIDKSALGKRWPFLEVRDLLESRGVQVPRVLAEDTAAGWLLLEDLGDHTLANYLLRHPERKAALYTQAVTDLAEAQRALQALPQGSVVKRRAFDEELLRWEIEHFREWALEARDIVLNEEDAHTFAQLAERWAKRVAALPRGFVHRDYQSRNLMVREREDGTTELVWIDFQDALLGPRTYDLVALLGDSYQEFDRAFVAERQREFAEAQNLSSEELASLAVEFDLVTVQRKLKDAGRFVFIDRQKGNASFLQFVTPTIRKVMMALLRLEALDLERHPEHRDTLDDARTLRTLLQRVLPTETNLA